MPLSKLTFKPGINRDQTNYSSEGGWYDCDKIRFRNGFPEKIGGWTAATITPYVGDARSLISWVTQDGSYTLIGVATNEKQYVGLGTQLYDITPIRVTYNTGTTPSTDNCFETTDTSTTVIVNLTAHGAEDGAYVTFSGATDVGGVPAAELNTEHQITLIDANSFSITVSTAATSTVASGGGTSIVAEFQINIGPSKSVAGYGWGTGTWSRGTWGSSSSTAVYLPARILFQESFNSDLIYNIITGDIYYWEFNQSFNTRAVLLSSVSGAVAVPKQVTKTMFAPSGHLLALGCTGYDAGAGAPDYEGDYDALLIRWSNVDATVGPQPEVWQPTVTNTAGFLRVKSGTRIITGLNARQETLIWTDTSISSLQFLGTQEVFGLSELSQNISITGPNAAVTANNVVYWMGRDKFYAYSGRVETLPCTVTRYVFEDINLEQGEIFFASTINEFNEVIWYYCSAGSDEIDRYVIYNTSENIWYYGQLERTAWIDKSVINNPLAAYNGYIYQHEDGHDDGQPLGGNPQPITSYIQSADIDIDDGDRYMLTKRIIPDVTFRTSSLVDPVTGQATTPEVTVTVGVRNFPGASNSTDDVAGNTLSREVITQATVNEFTNQVYVRARGRQINMRITADTLGTQWQLGIPRLDARPDGRRS